MSYKSDITYFVQFNFVHIIRMFFVVQSEITTLLIVIDLIALVIRVYINIFQSTFYYYIKFFSRVDYVRSISWNNVQGCSNQNHLSDTTVGHKNILPYERFSPRALNAFIRLKYLFGKFARIFSALISKHFAYKEISQIFYKLDVFS